MNISYMKDAIEEQIKAGYIHRNLHPTLPLFILNYGPKCQYEWKWTPEAMFCRGLVVDENWNIVLRSFEKFFTSDQYRALGISIPDEFYTVYDKLDGILFEVGIWEDPQGYKQLITATRGSFTSEWADIGRSILQDKYPNMIEYLDFGKTYNFELLSTRSREEGLTIVDYGWEDDIRLLRILDNNSGMGLPFEDIGPKIVDTFPPSPIKELESNDRKDAEGYVLEFESGFRLKIKLDTYKRIHHAMNIRSTKYLIKLLSQDEVSLEKTLATLPTSVSRILEAKIYSLKAEYYDQLCRACFAMERLMKSGVDLDNRKDVAGFINNSSLGVNTSILYLMFDKNHSEVFSNVWKTVAKNNR